MGCLGFLSSIFVFDDISLFFLALSSEAKCYSNT